MAVEKAKAKAKLVYRYEEVSRLAQVDRETLDNWEKEFAFLNAGRTGAGQKFFRQRDLDIILRIKALLAEKTLTMAGVKRRIEQEFQLAPAEPIHPDKLKKALYHVRDELNQIASFLGKDSGKKEK